MKLTREKLLAIIDRRVSELNKKRITFEKEHNSEEVIYTCERIGELLDLALEIRTHFEFDE